MSNKGLSIFFQLIGITLSSSAGLSNEKEYCSGEVFNPKCQAGEIIVMEAAFYGQMEIGRCIPTDMGYLGCKSNVLGIFDTQCSGKVTCNIFVGGATIPTTGGCMKGLSRYLQASYICIPEQQDLCTNSAGQNIIKLENDNVYITSQKLVDKCLSGNSPIKIQAKEGQNINVSLISLEGEEHMNAVFGSIVDPRSEKRVPFGGDVRKKHLMVSSSHAVELSIQQPSSKFILYFTVHGCQNMLPPLGAWMTRNGNEMELGCHSGSKTWTSKCENGQWIGSVGQCGQYNAIKNDIIVHPSDDSTKDPTLDVIVFGVSSLVILASAVIFLIGVCIFKRKIGMQKEAYGISPPLMQIDQLSRGTLPLKHPQLPQDMYMNSSSASGRESVQYFVLEESTKT